MNEAITCLSSSQWSDRRDGLVNLKNMMQSGRIFSRQEIKRLCEIFTRLFQDPHTKVDYMRNFNYLPYVKYYKNINNNN
jgi:CLIP-associating protein 1/2